mgnify:CR=1 FL=1|jgi:large subunit ribosomal protein L29
MAEIDDLRSLNNEDLSNENQEAHQASMNLRFRAATLQLSDMTEIKRIKKRIARIKTIQRQRTLDENNND